MSLSYVLRQPCDAPLTLTANLNTMLPPPNPATPLEYIHHIAHGQELVAARNHPTFQPLVENEVVSPDLIVAHRRIFSGYSRQLLRLIRVDQFTDDGQGALSQLADPPQAQIEDYIRRHNVPNAWSRLTIEFSRLQGVPKAEIPDMNDETLLATTIEAWRQWGVFLDGDPRDRVTYHLTPRSYNILLGKLALLAEES